MLLLQSRESTLRRLSNQVGFEEINLVLVRDMYCHVGAVNGNMSHVLLEEDVRASQAVKGSLMNEMSPRKRNAPSSGIVSQPPPSHRSPRLLSRDMAAKSRYRLRGMPFGAGLPILFKLNS